MSEERRAVTPIRTAAAYTDGKRRLGELLARRIACAVRDPCRAGSEAALRRSLDPAPIQASAAVAVALALTSVRYGTRLKRGKMLTCPAFPV